MEKGVMDAAEYQDPDYPVVSRPEVTPSPAERAARLDRARALIKRELQAELACREREVVAIDQRMWTVRRALHQLRSTLLQQHYGCSSTRPDDVPSEQRARPQVSAMLRSKQTRLHPSQRRLTGKSAVDAEEIFLTKQRGTNQQDMSAKSSIKSEVEEDRKRSAGVGLEEESPSSAAATSAFDWPVESTSREEAPATKPRKVPRHIEPATTSKIVTLDQGTRNRQKHKYRFIIGNTSKYSPPSSKSDRCSHKWLLYVRCAHACASRVVRSVTVRLHRSYAPHHTVHLHAPPFQVSRRGWGEFTAGVELHFPLPELNRPARVQHTVRLDKRCSGLQSLGAETIVDVWLYSTPEMLKYAEKDDNVPNPILPETNPDTHPLQDQWSDFFNTATTELDINEMIIKPVKKTKHKTDIEEIIVKPAKNTEHETNLEEMIMKPAKNRKHETNLEEMIVKPAKNTKHETCIEELKGKMVEPNIKMEPIDPTEDYEEVNIKEELLDYEITQEFDNSMEYVEIKQERGNTDDETSKKETKIVKYVHPHTKKVYYLEMDGKLDANKFKEIVLSDSRNSLLKNGSCLNSQGSRKYSHIQNDHCYLPMDQIIPISTAPKENFKGTVENGKKHRFDLGEVVSRMSCVRSAVNFLLGKIPLISDMADAWFKSMFPFVVKDEKKYWCYSKTRQRNIEWSRAKLINKILTKYFPDKTCIWRTKQILYFARLHGYYPVRPSQPDDEYLQWNDHEIQWELHNNMKKHFPTSSDINSGSMFDESRFTTSSEFKFDSTEPVELPCDSDDEIDIVGVASNAVMKVVLPAEERLEVLPIEDEEEKLRCFFIEKTCSEIGIELRNEDVGNGFSHSAVHRVMLSAVRCLAAELVRTALAETLLEDGVPGLWTTMSQDGSVGVQHVFQALRRHERLRVFTMESLYATPTDYSERL